MNIDQRLCASSDTVSYTVGTLLEGMPIDSNV
jgi:hypothetical protein